MALCGVSQVQSARCATRSQDNIQDNHLRNQAYIEGEQNLRGRDDTLEASPAIRAADAVVLQQASCCCCKYLDMAVQQQLCKWRRFESDFVAVAYQQQIFG